MVQLSLRAIVTYVAPLAPLALIAALLSEGCSTDTVSPATRAAQDTQGDGEPGSGPGSENGENSEDSGDADDVPASPTKIGQTCTQQCSPGQSCVGISEKGQHICLQACKAASDCPNHQKCTSGVCMPRCEEGCPSAMQCYDPGVNACFFDCKANKKLCGSGETCNDNYECVASTPDPVSVTCAPDGTASSGVSGVSGTKTMGALSAAEKATFCDWAAVATGGYNCEGACTGGTKPRFAASQSACITTFAKATCAATVASAEACIKENAQDVCALKILTSPTCASLRACM